WQVLDDEEVFAYFELLRRISGSRGAIRTLEVSVSDLNRLAKMAEKNYQFPELVARAGRDVRLDKLPASQVVADFAGSDVVLQTLHQNRSDEVKAALQFVAACHEEKKVPILRLVDVPRASLAQYLFPLVEKCLKAAQEADIPVRLRLADVLGLWHPHPQVALPRGLPRLLHHLIHDLSYPGEWIIVEPSNDSGMAASLAQSAWLYGVDAVAATLGGRGPRAGLGAMEGLLADMQGLRADAPKVRLALLRDLENLVTASGKVPRLPRSTPHLGEQAHAPRPSQLGEPLTSPFDATLVWGVRQGRVLGCRSTRQDVATWLKSKLGAGTVVGPEHPGIVRMGEWLASTGQEQVDEVELLRQARRFLPGFFVMSSS
ncbi:MAG: hypothetical protein AB7F75_01930, partial [Planctomycetota bacterium]